MVNFGPSPFLLELINHREVYELGNFFLLLESLSILGERTNILTFYGHFCFLTVLV